MHTHKPWLFTILIVIALSAWTLANVLDIISMFLFIQLGYRPFMVGSAMSQHPVEFALLYAGLRALGTLAGGLAAMLAEKRWPSGSQLFWNALTVAALLTALFAWLRLS